MNYNPLRRWIFRCNDFDGDEGFYLDADGNEVDFYGAEPWIGRDTECEREANRRAALWESRNLGLINDVTAESRGEVK
jgi:hypothetical protein